MTTTNNTWSLQPNPTNHNVNRFQCHVRSLTGHTLCREGGSVHAATIELSPWQKLDVTNQIRILHRLHPLS